MCVGALYTNECSSETSCAPHKFIYHFMMWPLPINCAFSQSYRQLLQSPGTKDTKLEIRVLSHGFPFVCFSPDSARVVNMPSVIYVAIGLPGFIRCPVDANPPVTLVKWKKDGLPLRIDKVSWCSVTALVSPTYPNFRLEVSVAFLQMKLYVIWFWTQFSCLLFVKN